MKRFLILLITFVMTLSLVGCANTANGEVDEPNVTPDEPKVTSAPDGEAENTTTTPEVTTTEPTTTEATTTTEETTTVATTTEATTTKATTVTTTEATVAVEDISGEVYMYAKSSVNVRTKPDADSERVGHLDKGEKVQVTGKAANGWYRIKFEGGEYFVSGSYLTDKKPAETTVTTEKEKEPEKVKIDPTTFMKNVRETMIEKEPAGSYVFRASTKYPTYEHVTYYSTTCGRERGVNIMLPGNYDENKEYPVLYALHGYWGDEHSLLDETGYAPIMFKQIVGNAVANGDAEEMIIVFPYIYASKDREFIEGGIDGTNNAAYDNFVNDLFNDLMPFVEANYSVKTGRENTAITGFSMGGRESIYIGLTHSDVFGYVGAVCPAPGVDSDLIPANQMKFKNEKPYLFFITAGSNDGVVGDTPSYYHGIFEDNDVDHVWHYVNGGTHDGVSIRAHVYNFVRYIFQAA